MRLAVHGATGRMGRAVVRLAHEAHGCEIVGAIADANAKELGRDVGEIAGIGPVGVVVTADVGSGILGADAIVDFSNAHAVAVLAKQAERARIPLVSGTTGLQADARAAIDAASSHVPVLWAANMSVGIEVAAAIAKMAVAKLGLDFDVEIVETHHRAKIDAPSGTALRLAQAIREVRTDLELLHGREGMVGPRRDGELAVVALRGGDVIGDHAIHLLGPGERIEITHRATNRDLFAHGALRAAKWLVGKPPARYTIGDIVGME